MNQMVKVLFDDPQTGEKVEELFGVPPGYDELEVQNEISQIMMGIKHEILF